MITKKKTATHSASKKVAPKKKSQYFENKDLLSMKTVTKEDLLAVFKLADAMKKNPSAYLDTLKGKTLGLLFQKPSNRTRISFEVGMAQLGGQAMYLSDKEIQMGEREPVRDVARTLGGYFDGVVLRTYSHATLEEFATTCPNTVINGLSDLEHPCQAISDLFTIYSKFGKLEGINLTYIGDSNNVLASLLHGCVLTGVNLCIVSPRGYEPTEEMMKDVKTNAKDSGSKVVLSNNPFSSLKNTHAIYTDVWTSMGQESERTQRYKDFQSFQVNETIVSKALPDCLVMHCLPAHRGEEITDDVIEGAHSIVFEQAINRLHAQKAVLAYMLGKK